MVVVALPAQPAAFCMDQPAEQADLRCQLSAEHRSAALHFRRCYPYLCAYIVPFVSISPALQSGTCHAGKLSTNSPKRAVQVRRAIEQLGPAYVKVAQAISTRVDVLDISYLLEIERLQDRVPPFPTKDALLVMAEGKSA